MNRRGAFFCLFYSPSQIIIFLDWPLGVREISSYHRVKASGLDCTDLMAIEYQWAIQAMDTPLTNPYRGDLSF